MDAVLQVIGMTGVCFNTLLFIAFLTFVVIVTFGSKGE
jgi:hypothetical protein